MSNGIIRNLFDEKLKAELMVLGVTKLKYPTIIQGIRIREQMKPTDDHIVTHLIPAPAESETLGGDHTVFSGIYQLTLNASSSVNGITKVEEMTDVIQSIFKINTRLIDPLSGLVVQVISPLKTTEGRVSGEGSKWWTIHAYFNYRSDV
jgi:hypothetical protein